MNRCIVSRHNIVGGDMETQKEVKHPVKVSHRIMLAQLFMTFFVSALIALMPNMLAVDAVLSTLSSVRAKSASIERGGA